MASRPDLTKLTDRELLLYVHRDLSDRIDSVKRAILTEVEGVRVAVADLAPVAGKVDELIRDVRDMDAAVRTVKGESKLAHARIVDLEAVNGRRSRR